MVGGILPWAFSPLLFHNKMSLLLIFLMGTNMIADVPILPAYIGWRRPNFVTRYRTAAASEGPDGGRANQLVQLGTGAKAIRVP